MVVYAHHVIEQFPNHLFFLLTFSMLVLRKARQTETSFILLDCFLAFLSNVFHQRSLARQLFEVVLELLHQVIMTSLSVGH